MPDMPVEFLPDPRYDNDMEARIAVLEHIAKTTIATLERLEARQEQLTTGWIAGSMRSTAGSTRLIASSKPWISARSR